MLAPVGDVAYQSEHLGSLHPAQGAVWLNHILSPACHPHFASLPTTSEQTARLVTASSHGFLSVGPSAFSCVVLQCSSAVKRHADLHAETRPRPILRLAGIANISQGGSRVVVPGIVSASVRKPKTLAPATGQPLRELSADVRLALHLPPVAAVCAALSGDRMGDSYEVDSGNAGKPSETAAEGLADGTTTDCTATRESCCLEDAVFSRIPNWVLPGFMRSSPSPSDFHSTSWARVVCRCCCPSNV